MELSEYFMNYKNMFFKSKKYWIIYLIFITIAFFSTFTLDNIIHPKFEIISFIIIGLLGIFCIIYYFLHSSDEELYKVAFVIILSFGIICALILPICEISDEWEHFTRAEITSQGVLVPHWTGHELNINKILPNGERNPEYFENVGFETITSVDLMHQNEGKTIFTTDLDTEKINYTKFISESSFEQNPFYGYLPQSIGIFIAKLLDLNVIWMLWLGRFFNILCYATIISLAIKITPYLKIPLLAISCIPISIYQSASTSIDSMIIALGLLTVAYFIYLCKSNTQSIGTKEILIFTLLCMLLGFCKITYFAFIFLLLFIPRNKFQNNKNYYTIALIIVSVSIITLLWSSFTTDAWFHSWRSNLIEVNSTQQFEYLVNNPMQILNFLKASFSDEIPGLLRGFFNFHGVSQQIHYSDKYNLISLGLQIFLFYILLAYPNNVKFDKITKFGSLLIFLGIYVGTCFIQLLTWAHVGQTNMGIGICIRYFIPLLALIPIITGFNIHENLKFDKYAMICIIGFMGALILSFATKYY